jgi:hypothetical protein
MGGEPLDLGVGGDDGRSGTDVKTVTGGQDSQARARRSRHETSS